VYVPKLLTTLQSYDRRQFTADIAAGVIVGIIALPLAIAFAIASGVTPDRGLYTAIIAGFIISVLGGSRVQIGGPTGAFVVIVYGIVQKFGIDGLIIATLMAGIILVILGAVRLGSVIKFIPHPVVIGFTSGIAIIIFSSEVKDLLGLRMGAVPADFIEKWSAIGQHVTSVNPQAVGLAVLTILIILAWPRINHRLPGPFIALLVATAAAQLLHLDVETIGSRFGGISAAFPHPSLPHVSVALVRSLVAPAFTIALLGAVESLLSAVVSDGMIGSRHRSNMELIAQGVANIICPLFGGIPATGAIARTATNVKNGGRTPVAGIVHALTLLLITLFFGRWAALIPLSVLAGILVIVAYNMSEWRTFAAEMRAPRSDVAVLLATFLLTVLVDLTVAIAVGMVSASFLFMRRMAAVTNVSVVTRELQDAPDDYLGDANGVRRRTVPDEVEIFEVNGPFFFGAAETFRDTLSQIGRHPGVLIVRLRNVPAIDSTGLHVLKELVHRARREGTLVLLSEVHMQPLVAISRSALLEDIGEANLLDSLDDALDRARVHLGLPTVERPAVPMPVVAHKAPTAA
jgi:SulP family sulfate permease